MYSEALSLVFILFAASSIGFLLHFTANGKQRDGLLHKLGLSRRRPNDSLTPPRELSPVTSPTKPPQYPTYENVFPPSRRHILTELPESALTKPGVPGKTLGEQPPDYSRMLPDKAKVDDDALLQHVTATGFSLEEIKRLGDFPDYATLSGIPMPAPYDGFDISTALPRPYRPFRWAYHQTMCKLTGCIYAHGIVQLTVSYSPYEDGHGLVARARSQLRTHD